MLSLIIQVSEIHPKEKIDVIKEDPEDNNILESAKFGKVKYIVSGDAHLLKLDTWVGIKIITAKNFLKIL